MIVNRRTFVMKPGHTEDAKWLVQESLRARPAGLTRPVRWYVISVGPWNLWAMEAEFKNLAEYERLVPEWVANHPPEFWQKYNEAVGQGGGNEIWTLLE